MQIKYLPHALYKSYNYACSQTTKDEQIKKRRKYLGDWEILKARKVPDKEIAAITGISRATYYRYKKSLQLYGVKGLERQSRCPKRFRQSKIPLTIKQTVLEIRKQNPTYGKDKITIILQRDFAIKLSASSVGRILKKFTITGVIAPSRSKFKKRRKRDFKNHAQPWQYGTKIKEPGQMIQIDHMSVTKNQLHFKHFQAWDPYTKMLVVEIYSNATALTAKKFLLKAIKELPFKIKSIQVDGGSEFMADFEEACAEHQIPLFVLPPRSPKLNGGVERANRINREEFYDNPKVLADSIQAMRLELSKSIWKYISYRPHHSLGGLTPLEYTNQYLSCQSHML